MDLSALPDAERDFYESIPLWADLGFAVAVTGGALGCLALLMRRSWAFVMLVLCLLGIVVQAGHSIFVGNGIEVFGTAGLAMPIFTFSIAAALAGFARHAERNGWLFGT